MQVTKNFTAMLDYTFIYPTQIINSLEKRAIETTTQFIDFMARHSE